MVTGAKPTVNHHVFCFPTEPMRAPTLLASSTTVSEHKDAAVLTCTQMWPPPSGGSVAGVWLREGRKLSQDHRSLAIDPVKKGGAGNYQCKVSNPMSAFESAPVELDVKYE